MIDREYWFTQTWSARERPDGTFEPGVPISGIGIGPGREDMITPAMRRHALEHFGNIPAGAAYFTIEAKFALEPAVSTVESR